LISIDSFDKDTYNEVIHRWDRVAKPLGSLGHLEKMTARIGAVQGSADIDISKRAVIMMCADNGIVAEGVSQSGQDVTRAVAEWMGRGESSVCKIAQRCNADTIPVDVGINMEGSPAGVINRKVMMGTRDFLLMPAMTEDECMQAVNAGIDTVCECSMNGYGLLAAGEMGIGNTTTSSALAAALLGLDVETVTGRGAGLSNSGLEHKKKIIEEALRKYRPDEDVDLKSPEYTMEMLAAVGGLDIAGMAGVFIGGAIYHIPVVIDGFISAVAALVADRLAPGCRSTMLASHCGREPGMKYLLDELGLEPVIDAGLALGEGTGAVMLFPLLDAALALYTDGLAFEETVVEQYEHFEDESPEIDS
jgi:nicotinate-nucleotide--dimethylbenzimidazole phosphoribosyltransferase